MRGFLLFCGVLSTPLPVFPIPDRESRSPTVISENIDPSFSNCGAPEKLRSGATVRFCMPVVAEWNGGLVVFAADHVDSLLPVSLSNLDPQYALRFIGSNMTSNVHTTSLPASVNMLGYAIGMTSMRQNGWGAVRHGVDDMADLVYTFRRRHSQPKKTAVMGLGQGGLIATLALERYPALFHGGLTICAPVGNFQWQVNYMGDILSVFDYFFPKLLPSPIHSLPTTLFGPKSWGAIELRVQQRLKADPPKLHEWLKICSVPVDLLERTDGGAEAVALQLLRDAAVMLAELAEGAADGPPYDNTNTLYEQAEDGEGLNKNVIRHQASSEAQTDLQRHFQTSGRLRSPMVSLSTENDPRIPFWQQQVYQHSLDDPALLQLVSADTYGGCQLHSREYMKALDLFNKKFESGLKTTLNVAHVTSVSQAHVAS